MRRAGFGLIALFVFGLSGCFLTRIDADSLWPSRSRSLAAAPGPDMVFMDVPVLEVPVGDPYVNDELWTAADEQLQSIAPALRKTLEDNGLRIGLIRGRTPDGLVALLTNDRFLKGKQFLRRTGNPATAAIGSRLDRLQVPLHVDGKSDTVNFEQAQCQLQLTPRIGLDSRVHIQFTPQIEFKDPKKWSRLNPVIAINVQSPRSTESISSLSWEVSLGPDDYLVIGARFDRPKTLGFKFLVSTDAKQPVQRLIAIRAGRFMSPGDSARPQGAKRTPGQAQPLAAQAAGG